MATTETRPGDASARERKVEAFVFDCVCHIFNFDPRTPSGRPAIMFDEHLYAFHQFLTKEGEKILSREEFMQRVERRRDLRDGHRGLRHRHDRRAAAAADRPVPRRPVARGRSARRWRRSTPTARCSGAT